MTVCMLARERATVPLAASRLIPLPSFPSRPVPPDVPLLTLTLHWDG